MVNAHTQRIKINKLLSTETGSPVKCIDLLAELNNYAAGTEDAAEMCLSVRGQGSCSIMR
jgi:hypothetical protein